MVRIIPASRSWRPPDKIQHFILDWIEQQPVDREVAALDIFLERSC
jgi:hypothetical protein